MNEIETIKKKIIDDLSAISDKDIMGYMMYSLISTH